MSTQLVADRDRLIERLKDELADARRERDEAKMQARENLAAANGLVTAIRAQMAPHFPQDTRDLEIDVLPQTIGGVTRHNTDARRVVEGMEAYLRNVPHKDWCALRKHGDDPDCTCGLDAAQRAAADWLKGVTDAEL